MGAGPGSDRHRAPCRGPPTYCCDQRAEHSDAPSDRNSCAAAVAAESADAECRLPCVQVPLWARDTEPVRARAPASPVFHDPADVLAQPLASYPPTQLLKTDSL